MNDSLLASSHLIRIWLSCKCNNKPTIGVANACAIAWHQNYETRDFKNDEKTGISQGKLSFVREIRFNENNKAQEWRINSTYMT